VNRQSWLARAGVAGAIAILAAGCTGGSGAEDKAGGGHQVVLTLAGRYSSIDWAPGVAYFVKRVGQLSDGALRITTSGPWGGDVGPDIEQRIVRDVKAGKADLGWVGTGVLDTLGIKSFQALTAPMLIDSYPLEQAVIASDIPGQMMGSLDQLGVKGLAVLGDSLRKPIALRGPILDEGDWSGIVFATIRSEAQAEAIQALGARSTDIWGNPLTKALEDGTVRGRDMGLFAYLSTDLEAQVPFVTANVNLWPQTLVLVANPDVLSNLTDQERAWLERAAQEAATTSSGLVDRDADNVRILCGNGANLTNASPADLAWLSHAFAPVYAQLDQDSQTKDFIDRIEQMKRSTPAGPELAIPEDCAGPGGDQMSGAVAGTWKTDRLTESQVVLAFVAAGGTEKDGHAWFSQLGQENGVTHDYAVITLVFKDGKYWEYESGDGGPSVKGSVGTYQLDDSGTLTIIERFCTGTYRVDASDHTLRMRLVKQCTDADAPYETALNAAFPFHR
jgi:TRAP-type C4-dicarboxylate transport system substrate-binding protein